MQAELAWLSTDGGQLFASTLLGAIIGAVVAGIIQAIISLLEHKRERRKEADANRERNKATALNTFVKAITLNNQLYSIIGLVVGMFTNAEAHGLGQAQVFQKNYPHVRDRSRPRSVRR